MTRESAFVRAPSVARAERGGEHENTARRSRRIDGARRRARASPFERSNDSFMGAAGTDATTTTTTTRARASGCLVVVCGKPSSGKTTAASMLAERLRSDDPRGANVDVVVVDEASVNAGDRNEAYADATREKMTRGALRSACDRALHARGPCVILDSLNAIKGFRYELWCCARAQATRYCVVHVDASDDDVEAWNGARREGGNEDAYDDAILRDLCFRFERPIASNRWDSPLFTFRPATDSEARVEDLLDAVCAHVRGDQSKTTPSARALVPNKATQNASLSQTNLRYEMDSATQEVCDAILSAQASNGGACCSTYAFGPGLPTLRCSRVLTLAELRRRKRDFLQLASKSLNASTTREGVKSLFVDDLQRAFA